MSHATQAPRPAPLPFACSAESNEAPVEDEPTSEHSMAEAPRGVSDSSAALVASSINGGGCLPPPTPSEKIAETLGYHMEKAVNPEATNYRDALPTSLAWRTTTQTMMVGGLAGEVTDEELAKIPLDLTSGPPC